MASGSSVPQWPIRFWREDAGGPAARRRARCSRSPCRRAAVRQRHAASSERRCSRSATSAALGRRSSVDRRRQRQPAAFRWPPPPSRRGDALDVDLAAAAQRDLPSRRRRSARKSATASTPAIERGTSIRPSESPGRGAGAREHLGRQDGRSRSVRSACDARALRASRRADGPRPPAGSRRATARRCSGWAPSRTRRGRGLEGARRGVGEAEAAGVGDQRQVEAVARSRRREQRRGRARARQTITPTAGASVSTQLTLAVVRVAEVVVDVERAAARRAARRGRCGRGSGTRARSQRRRRRGSRRGGSAPTWIASAARQRAVDGRRRVADSRSRRSCRARRSTRARPSSEPIASPSGLTWLVSRKRSPLPDAGARSAQESSGLPSSCRLVEQVGDAAGCARRRGRARSRARG